MAISDPDQDPLTIDVTTSNPAVVPLSGISVDDQAPDQSVTITPVIQTTAGSSLVTLTASDGASSAQLTIMVVVGTDEADTLTGTGDADLVVAGSGADTIASLGGPDLICGGQGADQADGGPGADTLDGSRGNDLLSGQAGDDTLLGGQGVDRLTGGADADAFSGGPGPDVLTDFTPAEGDTSDGT